MNNSGKASASADIKGTNAGVKDRIILTTERVLCYIVLILITFLCLFSFYVLIINTTRSHPDIQKGFSFLPGKSFVVNMKNVLANENIPVIKGMFNSLFSTSKVSSLPPCIVVAVLNTNRTRDFTPTCSAEIGRAHV